MAIAEMRKMRLLGLTAEKERIVDALAATGAVQIKELEAEDTPAPETETCRGQAALRAAELRARADALRAAAEYAEDAIRAADKKNRGAEALPAYCTLPYSEFLKLGSRSAEALALAESIETLRRRILELDAKKNKAAGLIAQAEPYLPFRGKFSELAGSRRTGYALGAIAPDGLSAFSAWADRRENPVAIKEYGATPQGARVIFACALAADREAALAKLAELGFSPCPFSSPETPAEMTARLAEEIAAAERAREDAERELYARKKDVPTLRMYADYNLYLLEKAEAEGKFGATRRTFELEAYLPAEAERAVSEAVTGAAEAVYYEFAGIAADEMPPTLMKNPRPVKQFEFITNMYSPPNYRELDPNPVMSVFFLLFFGFIMADIGYGLLLFLGAGALALRKKRDTGGRRLMWILCMGGLFTALFGALFGSFFGFTHAEWSVIPESVMPDPQAESQKLLVWCLLAGLAQILVAFVLKGVQLARRGEALDAVFDGFLWAGFFVGAAVAAIGMFESTLELPLPDSLPLIGGIIAGAALITEILAAGRHAKGFGKFTKGFGAAYGVIEFFSDILSYARLFGLMLSGAIISSIVSEMSASMMTGAAGTIAGGLVFLVGHAFNLAMGVLGAYIHDSRLQYIEFFKRFYEGEGELFRPLASSLEYIALTK